MSIVVEFFCFSFSPQQEHDGPPGVEEGDDDADGQDAREDGEEDEGVADHDEQEGEGLALVEQRRRAEDVHQADEEGQAVELNWQVSVRTQNSTT